MYSKCFIHLYKKLTRFILLERLVKVGWVVGWQLKLSLSLAEHHRASVSPPQFIHYDAV